MAKVLTVSMAHILYWLASITSSLLYLHNAIGQINVIFLQCVKFEKFSVMIK